MKNFSDDPSAPLNQTAAMLMAAAVVDLFPGVLLAGGQGSFRYFYHDFVFPFEFKSEFLPLIEERMRFLIRERKPVRSLEMMPSNAAALMTHLNQGIAASQLMKIRQATVQMAQIGDFTVFCPLPLKEELSIPFLKILEGYPLEDSRIEAIRIVGAVASSKEILKELARQSSISSQSHLTHVREMALSAPMEEEGMWFWRPKGDQLRQQLIQWLRTEYGKQNFDFISTPVSLIEEAGERNILRGHREYFLRFGTSKIVEMAWILNVDYRDPSDGLFSPKAFFCDRANLFCSDEKLLEECISSLRFILKIPKILGFEFEIVLSVSSEGSQKAKAKGSALFRQVLESVGFEYTIEKEYRIGTLASIDVRFTDSLGRRWTGPFLSIPDVAMPVGKGRMLTCSVFGSLERMCALLLEKKGGWLPLFLAPQQVRILVASSKTDPYAKEVHEALSDQGFRVTGESGEEK
jgi:threonyl-tRNA synthetase